MNSAKHLTVGQRGVALIEVWLAISIVIAHNVYHLIPNEVPILFVMAVASFRIREGNWGLFLYAREGWTKRMLLVAACCVVLLIAKDEVLEPIGHYFWTAPEKVSTVISGSHSAWRTIGNLIFVWIFAAFGEEIGYRGYLLRRALDVFGPSRWGAALALLVASIAFGFGHFYKGPTGILESTGSGIILGGAYLLTRRLWASTLAHGTNDTLAILLS